MHYFISALKKYAVFSGRSRRAEYWYFVLFSTLIGIGVGTLDVFIYGLESDAFVTPSLFISLAMMVPSIAVGARRHAVFELVGNRKGAMLAIALDGATPVWP